MCGEGVSLFMHGLCFTVWFGGDGEGISPFMHASFVYDMVLWRGLRREYPRLCMLFFYDMVWGDYGEGISPFMHALIVLHDVFFTGGGYPPSCLFFTVWFGEDGEGISPLFQVLFFRHGLGGGWGGIIPVHACCCILRCGSGGGVGDGVSASG